MKKNHLIELRNSLRRRGFWVNVVDGEFILDGWYSRSHYYEMIDVLQSVQILLEIGVRGVRVNSNSHLSDEILNQIEAFNRNEVKASGFSRLTLPATWNYPNTHDLSFLELDYGIASLVFSLNKVGLNTSMSCDGHGQREPKLWFNRHQYLESIQKLLEKANREISFAYDWEVLKENTGMILTARKRLRDEQWNVSKVQDDALAFSDFLLT